MKCRAIKATITSAIKRVKLHTTQCAERNRTAHVCSRCIYSKKYTGYWDMSWRVIEVLINAHKPPFHTSSPHAWTFIFIHMCAWYIYTCSVLRTRRSKRENEIRCAWTACRIWKNKREAKSALTMLLFIVSRRESEWANERGSLYVEAIKSAENANRYIQQTQYGSDCRVKRREVRWRVSPAPHRLRWTYST